MLYQHVNTLYVHQGPCRQDLVMALNYAKDQHNDVTVMFCDEDGVKRKAKIIGFEHTNVDDTVKLKGEIQWWSPDNDPQFRIKIMAAFAGTYNLRVRSGQFEVTSFTADGRH